MGYTNQEIWQQKEDLKTELTPAICSKCGEIVRRVRNKDNKCKYCKLISVWCHCGSCCRCD